MSMSSDVSTSDCSSQQSRRSTTALPTGSSRARPGLPHELSNVSVRSLQAGTESAAGQQRSSGTIASVSPDSYSQGSAWQRRPGRSKAET